MVRECALALALTLSSTGCSLVLDFSGDVKATVDAPYSMVECDYKEPNDTRETAAVLDVAEVGLAAICPTMMGVDDHDFYKITLPASSMVQFKISYNFFATGDVDLQLTDAGGAVLSSSRGFDNDEIIACPGSSPPCVGPLAAGDYVLEVFPAQPGMANRYDIAITVTP
jgi:hypothetical protein